MQERGSRVRQWGPWAGDRGQGQDPLLCCTAKGSGLRGASKYGSSARAELPVQVALHGAKGVALGLLLRA